jgi:gluconokinase
MIIVVMGVTGAGKTTIGRLLAHTLGWTFVDGDEFHPLANVEKMRAGIPLTDADRQPWLDALRQAISSAIAQNNNIVLACSALKQRYRRHLQIAPEVRLVYLKGSYELIAGRLRDRHGHFATAALLASQFSDLEEPSNAFTVDIGGAPEEIVAAIRKGLGLA